MTPVISRGAGIWPFVASSGGSPESGADRADAGGGTIESTYTFRNDAGSAAATRTPTGYGRCPPPRVGPGTSGDLFGDQPFRLGPSPLARGIPAQEALSALKSGSIPARAGHSSTAQPVQCTPRVHPRSRGASARAHRGVLRRWGPSPLARGILGSQLEHHHRGGSIPARAGHPSSDTCDVDLSGVHPRSRGASGHVLAPPDPHPGPSPRSRGASCSSLAMTARGLGPSPLARGIPGLCQLGRV